MIVNPVLVNLVYPQLPACTCTFEELVLPLRDDLVNFARRLTFNDIQRADDITQDALVDAVKVWHRLRLSDPHQEIRTYLYRLIYNRFSKDYRRGKIRAKYATERPDDIADATHGQPDMSPLTEVEMSDEVSEALDKLLPEHKDILIRHYVMGQNYKEIADATGVAIGTVNSRLSRARNRLGPMIAQYAKVEYGLEVKPITRPKRIARGSAVDVWGEVAKEIAGSVSGPVVDAPAGEPIEVVETEANCIDRVMAR